MGRKNYKIAQKLLLWEPAQGKMKSDGPKYTYVDQLRVDTGLEKAHLEEKMQNKEKLKCYVRYVQASSST